MQPGDIIFVDNYRMLHGELVEGGGRALGLLVELGQGMELELGLGLELGGVCSQRGFGPAVYFQRRPVSCRSVVVSPNPPQIWLWCLVQLLLRCSCCY